MEQNRKGTIFTEGTACSKVLRIPQRNPKVNKWDEFNKKIPESLVEVEPWLPEIASYISDALAIGDMYACIAILLESSIN